MKTISNEQLTAIKHLSVEALGSMYFNRNWIGNLKSDLDTDQDRATNAMELARYIAWHMEHHKFTYGLTGHTENHFAYCAFQAVLFATNETLALNIN